MRPSSVCPRPRAGGPIMITLGQGTDCTLLFEQYHALVNVPRLRLATFDVTDDLADGEEPPVVPECPSAFYREASAAVRAHFASKEGDGALCGPLRFPRLTVPTEGSPATPIPPLGMGQSVSPNREAGSWAMAV